MARRAGLLVVVAVLAAASGLVLDATGALNGLENPTIDARFRIRSDDTRPRDVVVLGMDTQTLHELHGFPLPRRYHAQAVAALARAGAKTIAYDLDFVGETKVRDDNALLLALRRHPGVILAAADALQDGSTLVLGGRRGQRFARVRVGFAAFQTTKEGDVLRRVHARIRGLPTFPAVAAGTRDFGTRWIDYRGDPQVIPFMRAIRGDLPDLRGKIVVVGDVSIGGQDNHATPVGQRFGPEINAVAIDTLLRGDPIRDVSGWWMIVLLGIAVPLSALRLTGLRWLPVAAGLQAAWLLGTQLAFDGGSIVPFVPGEAALIVGGLGALVIAYAFELRRRRMLRTEFARFAPPIVVDTLVEQEGAPPARLEATVLFADLRGFTAAAERLGAEGVIALLNRYLGAMSDAVLDHGGTVVSFMGDGIMAVFGAPVALPDHADRALAAARELVERRLPAFNAETGEAFALGVGVASGPVMSGTVGSARRIEYAAVGDTTNLAARLEQLTKELPHAVLIADATRAALSDPAGLAEVGEHVIRGRAQAVRLWTLAGTVPGHDA
jgi:adenylate cyclase